MEKDGMEMQITFNTGRLYTRNGQVITARYSPEDCEMTFYDHSRMVGGRFPYSIGERYSAWQKMPQLMARVVIREYDRNAYSWLIPSEVSELEMAAESDILQLQL